MYRYKPCVHSCVIRMARARRARGGQSPQRFVLYTKFSAKFSTKFSTLMEDGAAAAWCFQSGVPVVYLYCVRRNNIIMVVAGLLLFRPTQLKLDGILTCTCTSMY